MLNWIKKFFSPRPTIFDLSIALFLIVPWIQGNRNRAIFIVFYAAFLVAYSLNLTPKRLYRSLPLTLLVSWSLINVFIHSFAIYPTSMTSLYPTYYLMLEGFLYIFFGALFIKTVVTYSTNIRFIYVLLPFAIFPWYGNLQRTGNVTTMAALGAAILVYLVCSKRYKLSLWIGLLGWCGLLWHWKWVCLKFSCRPIVWRQLFINTFYRPVRYIGKDIIDPGIEWSPFFERFVDAHIGDKIKPWLATLFGGGFPQILDPNYIWVSKNNYGWLYRQSDYGAIANDLGLLMLILVVWFIIDSYRKIGIHPMMILFTMIVLASFTQVTMYLPYKAGIYLMIIALSITEGLRRREV